MKKVFIRKIKETLLQKKSELLNKKEKEVNIDTDGDEVDKIQGNMIIEMQNQLETRNLEKVVQIENALSRIEKNIYGLCEECEEEISEQRLILNPYFKLCISCQEAKEILARRK